MANLFFMFSQCSVWRLGQFPSSWSFGVSSILAVLEVCLLVGRCPLLSASSFSLILFVVAA